MTQFGLYYLLSLLPVTHPPLFLLKKDCKDGAAFARDESNMCCPGIYRYCLF